MTAPAIAPITIEERLATVEATLAAFIAEEREWRSQFVAEQREYRRETNARFDALTATLAEYRQETANAFAEQRRETAEAFAEYRRETVNAFAEQRRETANAFAEHRQITDARMARMESNLTRIYLAIIGLMGAMIVAGVGGAIAILSN